MPRHIALAAILAMAAFAGCLDEATEANGSIVVAARGDYRAIVSVLPASVGRVTVRATASTVGLEIRTGLVSRDVRLVAHDDVRRVVAEEAGRLRVELGDSGIVERFTARERGVEQTWHFETKPTGRGELVVEVDFGGAEFVRSDTDGLLFAAADEALMRYGHAAWIDARGERTYIASEIDGDRIVLRVPADVIDASRYPAVLDPMVGPAMPVSDARPGPTSGTSAAQVQFDGTNYFFAYRDGAGVWGIRMTPAGSFVDAAPFSIPSYSEVVCSGTTCVALYRGLVTNTIQRFETNGTLLDPAPVTLAGVSNARAFAYAAGFLVVGLQLESDGRSNDLVYRHYRLDGSAVESDLVRITIPGSQPLRGGACGPTNCLITFGDTYSTIQLMAARIAHDGTLLDPSGFAVFTGSTNATVVHDGRDYVVHKSDAASRIADDGTILTPTPFSLPTGGDYGACNSNRCFLSGGADYSILEHGSTTATRVEVTTGISEPLRLACSNVTCATTVVRTGVLEVRLLDSSGVIVTAPFGLVGRPPDQSMPSVTSNGTGYFATWGEIRAGKTDVYAARIDPLTGTLDPYAIVVTNNRNHYDKPDVTFGSGTYMVALHRTYTASEILVARVAPDGTARDASSPVYLGAGDFPSIAFDGTNFLTVWRDNLNRIVGRRVNAVAATLESSPFPISAVGMKPDVAFDGTNYLVVWHETRSGRAEEVYGARIARDGSLLDVTSFPIGSELAFQGDARIAFDGTNYLVVWIDGRHAGEPAIYAARVTPSGAVLDVSGIPVARVLGGSFAGLGLAWDGGAFVVTWQHQVFREFPSGSGMMRLVGDLYASRVASGGMLLDATPTLIERDILASVPAVSAGSRRAGESLIAFVTRLSDADRVMVRLFTTGVRGVMCTAATDCDSGYCVDGVCCDSACTGDCEACAIVAGASADGTCAPAAAGTVCRASSGGACDVDEVCDGVAGTCPADVPDPMCPMDAGTTDDGGTVDLDAGAMDDAGMPMTDAGVPMDDAGMPMPDAGMPMPDAGMPMPDAGTPIDDAGMMTDAGTSMDAGTAPPDPDDSGCSCRAAGARVRAPTPLFAIGALLLLLGRVAARRRR